MEHLNLICLHLISLDYRYWEMEEPNNYNNEDCVEIWADAARIGWNDQNCNNKGKWICEKPFF